MSWHGKMLGLFLLGGVLLPDAWAQGQEVDQVEQSSATTPRQKLDFASSALDEMRAGVKTLTRMLEVARKEQAPVKIECLNRKLTAVRTLQEVSAGAREAMQEALAANEPERANHEFRKLAVALAKVRQFLAEAQACLGTPGATPGVITIDVSGEGLTDVSDTEPIDDGDDGGGIDPPDGSPFE